MFCKKCGNQIDDDSAFCYKCGAAISKVIQEKVQNVQTSTPVQNVQTSIPVQDVRTSAPAQNVQTNSSTSKPKIQIISARGQEVTSTAPIESKYKVGKIITMVVFIGFSLFIPLPQDNWVLTFLIVAAFSGLLGWNALSAATMFIIRKIETERYASYINSESAENIIKLLAQPLIAKGMHVCPCNKGSNVVLVTYQGKEYELYFFKEGYFNIAPDRPVYMHGIEGMKIIKMPFIYEHSLEDFPVIAYCVQEILKNA